MAALIGVIGEFDAEKEEWTQYAEHLSHFFEANLIVDEERKKITSPDNDGPISLQTAQKFGEPSEAWRQDLCGIGGDHEATSQSDTLGDSTEVQVQQSIPMGG